MLNATSYVQCTRDSDCCSSNATALSARFCLQLQADGAKPAAGGKQAAAAAPAAAAAGGKQAAATAAPAAAAAAAAAAAPAAAAPAAAPAEGKKGKKEEGAKEGGKKGGDGGKKKEEEEPHVGLLDIRVGTIVKVSAGPSVWASLGDVKVVDQVSAGYRYPKCTTKTKKI